MIAPARLAAYEVLRAVASGRTDLGAALSRQRARLDDERDRALAGEIATGTLRWQGAYDHVIAAFSNRPLRKLDPEILDMGTVQVTAVGAYDFAYCKVWTIYVDGIIARCYAGNGMLVDAGFTALLGS